jgi:Kef-type K+ transport system membrane component KefB
VGWLAKKLFRQPQAVGEMVAGVLLGPSMFGFIAPELQRAVFPSDSKSVLFVVAQLGIGLYMFLVGLSFQSEQFKSNAKSAMSVSVAGMSAPFLVAVLISPWLFHVPGMFGSNVTLFQATFFMGAAISITAFPMLARILQEHGLSQTPLGTLCLSAGAIADAVAWTVLAIVLASFGDGSGSAVKTIVGGIGFAFVMLALAPRLLAPLARIAERAGQVSHALLAVMLMLFMLCAFVTDAIGIHAVFGGFLFGVAVPRGLLANELRRMLEPLVVVLLVPVFFTFSGLHTQLTMIDSLGLVMISSAILAGSILAKAGACWGAARLTGQDNATALAIGVLMNARGMMELILINIGLQRGIIGPALFSILALMTIVTTLMASPLLELVYGRRARESQRGPIASVEASSK